MTFKALLNIGCFALLGLNSISHANPEFLPPDKAFQLSVESISAQKAQYSPTTLQYIKLKCVNK